MVDIGIINASYMNATRSWMKRRDDLLVVGIWLIMLSYSLIANVLIIIGIGRTTTMRTAPSYWIITSLAICDIVMSTISLVHLVPATAFHSAFLEFHAVRNIVMMFCYNFVWYTAVLQLGLMAINRFISIVYPMEYKSLFSPMRSFMMLCFGYALGLLVSIPSLFPCCHTLWNSDFYITVYDPMDTWYKYVDMSVNSLSLVTMIASYSVIIYKVRKSSKAMAKYQLTIRAKRESALKGHDNLAYIVKPPRRQISKKEMRLFVQFFIVSIVFLVTWTTWQWLPHISESKWAYFIMTSLFFINNSVNPTIYLLFNTQLRRELSYLLCSRTGNDERQKRLRVPSSAHTIHDSPPLTMNRIILHRSILPSDDSSIIDSNGKVQIVSGTSDGDTGHFL